MTEEGPKLHEVPPSLCSVHALFAEFSATLRLYTALQGTFVACPRCTNVLTYSLYDLTLDCQRFAGNQAFDNDMWRAWGLLLTSTGFFSFFLREPQGSLKMGLYPVFKIALLLAAKVNWNLMSSGSLFLRPWL